METITLKLTKEEYSLIENSEFEWSRFAYDIDLKVDDVDKFREFLNDEIDPHGFGRGNIDRITFRNLKSILSKFYNALLFKYHNNPMDNYELEDDGLTIDDIK